jgi:hypothetical protein
LGEQGAAQQKRRDDGRVIHGILLRGGAFILPQGKKLQTKKPGHPAVFLDAPVRFDLFTAR